MRTTKASEHANRMDSSQAKQRFSASSSDRLPRASSAPAPHRSNRKHLHQQHTAQGKRQHMSSLHAEPHAQRSKHVFPADRLQLRRRRAPVGRRLPAALCGVSSRSSGTATTVIGHSATENAQRVRKKRRRDRKGTVRASFQDQRHAFYSQPVGGQTSKLVKINKRLHPNL